MICIIYICNIKIAYQSCVTNKDITNSVSDTISSTHRKFILIHLKWEI
nr:MAG TPA: hypothetical protein [Caudoviricetes sp.]